MALILLGTLRPVFGAALATTLNARSIQRAANGVIPNSRQILNPPPANQHDRMLLQIMPLAADVSGDFKPIRQPHPRRFAQGGIGLLRRRRINAQANAPLLRTPFQRRRRGFIPLRTARISHQLINRRHLSLSFFADSRAKNTPFRGRKNYADKFVRAAFFGKGGRL